MYSINKDEVGHNLADFIATDDLVSLADAINAGLLILKENDCLELVTVPSDYKSSIIKKNLKK